LRRFRQLSPDQNDFLAKQEGGVTQTAAPPSVRYCIWSSIADKDAFTLSAFFISSALTNGYSPCSRKAWALMFAHEPDECRSIRLRIHRETFQIFERGADPETAE
jgi:hypothetical protein